MSQSSPQQAIKSLMAGAQEPLAWEIGRIGELKEAGERLAAFKFREIPQKVNRLTVQAEREVYIDLIVKAGGFSLKAVEDLLEHSVDLYKQLNEKFRGDIRKADPLHLSSAIFEWFANGAGGRFFKTSDGKAWLFYHGEQYELTTQSDLFNALMYRLTKLAAIEKPGNMVWYYLKMQCLNKGEPIDMVSWLYTDREADTIYLNLNSPHSKILRIAPGEVPALIDNGTNEHGVLLSSSPQIKQFQYLPNASEAEGFSALKKLLMDTTPCEGAQRYMLMCWMITMFLMDYQGDRGLLQITAPSGVGKSKVGERMSQLLYGFNFVGSGTGAADVRIATRNPLTFLDNIENRDLSLGRIQFLLMLANSSVKPKSKAGSDTEVLYQKLKSMGFITSIEPFPGRLSELINRTFPLMLEPRYMKHGYMHDELMRTILKERNLILSAIMKMIGRKVLPRLEERSDWSKILATTHAGHNKSRMNEHLCMMTVVLEGILEHLPWKEGEPVKKQAAMMLDRWIEHQEEQAHQVSITSNTLLNLLDGLGKEVWLTVRKMKDVNYEEHDWFERPVFAYEDPEYLERFYVSEPFDEVSEDDGQFSTKMQTVSIIMTAAELEKVFRKHLKKENGRYPFDNPSVLGSRLGNDNKVLGLGGWRYVSGKDTLQWKKIRGARSWRLEKNFEMNW